MSLALHLVSQLGGLGASGHGDGINQVADLVNGGSHLLVESLQGVHIKLVILTSVI